MTIDKNNDIKVGGTLHSIATGNIIAHADEIKDDNLNIKQSDFNEFVNTHIFSVDESDKVLSVDNKTILSNIKLQLDNVADSDGKKWLRLLGKDDSDLGKVELSNEINTLMHSYLSGNLKTINGITLLGEGDIVIEGGSGETPVPVEPLYNPTISESTAVTNGIGSIEIGTLVGELKGKSFSKIIDMMLISENWYDPKYKHNINMTTIPKLVKVGSSVQYPSVTAVWNTNIIPHEGVTADISLNYTSQLNDTPFTWGSSKTYTTSGTATFEVEYDYGDGYYNITSNLGNSKTIDVPTNTGTLSTNVDITYPWFINDTEQTLVKIGTPQTITKVMGGQPSIKVPFTNSEITILVDLGFGYMDVEWDETIDNSNLGGAIDETVPYKILTKPDSYSTEVPHKITVKIIK